MTNPKPRPGLAWRISADDKRGLALDLRDDLGRSTIDEVRIGQWLHVEQLTDDEYCLSICGRMLWVSVQPDGSGRITMEEPPKPEPRWVEALRLAHHDACTCGGAGPGEGCPACEVWHGMKESMKP